MSVFFFFISETTSVKEGERSWQPNTFFFALWTEIICLLFYSWQQKLDHKVSNMHINGLKGQIGVLLSLCPVVYVSFPLCLLLFCTPSLQLEKSRACFSSLRQENYLPPLQCCSVEKQLRKTSESQKPDHPFELI